MSHRAEAAFSGMRARQIAVSLVFAMGCERPRVVPAADTACLTVSA